MPCQKTAGWGTTHRGYGHCRLHGGASPNGEIYAAKIAAAANGERIARVMGLPVEVEPFQALLNTIYVTAGEVEYTTMKISELHESDAITDAAELHVWITARQDCVDRLARYAKMAMEAGVAERQVRVTEHLGGMIGKLVSAVLDDLALSAEQKLRAPDVVRLHLAKATG